MSGRGKTRIGLTTVAAAMLAAPGALAQTQGVTATEVVIGTHQAMSGPLAGFSVPLTEGMRMRIDEFNEQGGLNGRRLRLIIEDNQFNPARSAQVGNKLLNSDKVFAIVGALGTPPNVVVMEEAFKLNVPNLFPAASGRQMFEPLHKLKFAIQAPHYDNLRNGVKWIVENKKKKAICTLAQDNEFGKEIATGVEAQAKAMNMPIVAQATHRADDQDFSAQMTKLRSAGCDLIGLGTVIKDTIGIMSTARRMGWGVDFVGSSSPVTPETISLAQGATEDLYAISQFGIPYENAGTPFAQEWYKKFVQRFGRSPGFPSVAGYVTIDLFIEGLKGAGKDVTVEGYVGALEKIDNYRDPFGSGPPIKFTATKHLGTNQGFLAQIKDGKWVKVASDLSY